jgi:hypothetical protein
LIHGSVQYEIRLTYEVDAQVEICPEKPQLTSVKLCSNEICRVKTAGFVDGVCTSVGEIVDCNKGTVVADLVQHCSSTDAEIVGTVITDNATLPFLQEWPWWAYLALTAGLVVIALITFSLMKRIVCPPSGKRD